MKYFAKQSGFTLIEISIVIIVMGLILGGLLQTISNQRQQIKRDETRQQLEVIKEALIGFALTNGRLPCSDTTGDGLEDFLGGVPPGINVDCDSEEGGLPYADIGIGQFDTWGNRFRYRVTGTGANSFADQPAAGTNSSFAVGDNGDIAINDQFSPPSIATSVPAIIVSFAENGAVQAACGAGLSASETENCDADTTFFSGTYNEATGNYYDDLVTWIPLTVLKARMIAAGRLP